MKRTWAVEQRSLVPASAAEVWDRVVTPEGINHEMRPWLTMSIPRGASDLSIDTIQVGEPVGRSWLRLFGVLPFDYDHLMIAELEPGRRFREESTMLSMRRWTHERTVEAEGDNARVIDEVTMTPRIVLRLAGPALRIVIAAFFRHRHRRLARYFV